MMPGLSQVEIARDALDRAAAAEALANHNLQEYRNLRDRADELVRVVEAYWPNSHPPSSIHAAIRKLREVKSA